MKFIKIITLFLAFVLAGCNKVQPIMNIEDTPVAYELTQQEVKQAIVRAAESRKWIVKDVSSNELKAEVFVRTHHAVIKIPYNSTHYSLIYADSSNLLHEGDNIHRNYNKWITLLNESIRRELGIISNSK
ncbi:hypothetical protein P7F88_16235 [Vibrio hannami]|uniref:hypothetical protein n=1 Tax=Vibrio hannami TaxID=2717094 RepID=UPI00240FC5E3|nr:hypothetical protein [Vibrio hannami]MDG3087526.1 hypothetical protein [Vibrio hannami]